MTGRATAARWALLGATFALAACSGAPVRRTARRPGFLGVFTDDRAQKLDRLWTQPGVVVLEIFQGSPAAMAGLQQGDTIVAVDGDAVADGAGFDRLMSGLEPGDRVKMTVLRGAARTEREAILVERTGLPKAAQPREAPARRTLVVAPDGTGDFLTLSGAMFSSRRGDSIELKPGEHGTLHLFRDDVEIRGSPAAVVDSVNGAHGPSGVVLKDVVVAPAGGGSAYGIVLLQASGIKVLGGSVSGAGTGIRVAGSRRVTLEGVRVRANLGTGLFVDRSQEVRVADSRIEDNRAGIEAVDSQLELSGNTIARNDRPGRPGEPNLGVHLERSDAVLEGNTIADNRSPGSSGSFGVRVHTAKSAKLRGNVVAGHEEGVWLSAAGSAATPEFSKNILWDNVRDFGPPGAAPPAGFSNADPGFLDREAGIYERGAPRPAAPKKPSAPAPAAAGERTPKRKLRLAD